MQYLKGLAAILSMCLVLVSADGVMAQTSPPSQEDLQAERDRLFGEILKQPSNLDLLYAYAQVTIALGDYDAAIASYERMLIFNPDLPRVHLELGVLYFRAGSNQVARYHLELARNDPSATPQVKARVDEYLAAIDAAGSSNKFDGTLFAGLRYQTNANAGPPAGTKVQVGTLPGFAELEEGTEQSDYNAVLSGTLNHHFDLGNQTYDTWDSNLFFYGAAFAEQEQLNLGTSELKTGPKFNHVLFRDFSVRPYAAINWVGLDDSTYFWSWGAGLGLEYLVLPELTAGLDLQWRDRRYSEDYADREGDQYLAQASLRWTLGPRDMVTLGGALVRTTAQGDWRAYLEGGGTLAYTHLMPASESFLGLPIAATLYAGGRYTDYDAPDPLIQPDTERADRELRGGGSLVLALDTDVSLVATTEYRSVKSNIDFYSFDNLAVTLGLLFRF
jgi:hypothetical protein